MIGILKIYHISLLENLLTFFFLENNQFYRNLKIFTKEDELITPTNNINITVIFVYKFALHLYVNLANSLNIVCNFP